jgi:RNA polymerase sigma-70 factor (ECF subfamily)
VSESELLFIHRALLTGEPTAPRRLVSTCAAPLCSILRRDCLPAPLEVVQDAAHDALLFLIAHPERYNAQQGSVMNFLVHIAHNKLIDKVRVLQRHQKREIREGDREECVELVANETNKGVEEQVDNGNWARPEQVCERGATDALSPEIAALLREILPDERDRRLLSLVGAGRTAVADYAAVLEIMHLSPQEQRVEVKRHRDRVLKRVQRRRKEWEELLL